MDYQGGDTSGGFNTNDGNQQQSQSSQGNKPRRSYDEQTLIPVTIHMLNQAKPDESGDQSVVLEDGRKLAQVKLLGSVRGVEDASTNVLYTLEDGTGMMDVKQWLDDNDGSAIQEMRQQTLKENIYVKVIGQVKDYDGKKMVVANSVRLLTTGNELTHHFLQVVHSAEKYKRADSIVAPLGSTGVGFGATIGGNVVTQTTGGGDSLRDKVLKFIQTADDGGETGVNVISCVKAMTEFSEADIRKAIAECAEEGMIYSTVSEDDYKYAM
jgi:replication factor A2